MKEKVDNLIASEALYGFAGWLTGRKQRTVMSSTDDAAGIADLVAEFCKANDLQEPRPKWDVFLCHPEPKTTKYRNKSPVIEAHQWFKNGDHPEDNCGTFIDPETKEPFQGEGNVVRYFRHPDVDGESICSECGIRFHEHGWIDTMGNGHRVCPGNWVITHAKDEYHPCKPDIFELTHDPVSEERA